MSNYSVKLTVSATKDWMVISDFYVSALDAVLADKMIKKLEEALEKLAEAPEHNPAVPELAAISAKHYLQYLSKPLRLIYRVEGKTVYVTSLLHQKKSITKVLQNRVLQ
jgi:plasmid stabilization system protein ParE